MAEVDTRPEGTVLEDAPDNMALTTTSTEVAAPTEKKVRKIIRRKKKPARPQIDPALITSEPPPQTGTTFNIWYNKWSGGDREDKYLSQTHAKGRCNIAQDSGYTRADGIPGSYFCLFFARGICPKGQDCNYLHRLPGIHDLFNPNEDCFGVCSIISSPSFWYIWYGKLTSIDHLSATNSPTTEMTWAVLVALAGKTVRYTSGAFTLATTSRRLSHGTLRNGARLRGYAC